jgi:septal ring factor EnvC (AmiA/AmiB activator)
MHEPTHFQLSIRTGPPPLRKRGIWLALPLFLTAVHSWTSPEPLHAQGAEQYQREIQESQRRLEQIREERSQLQREMESLRPRVLNVSGELLNIERQLAISRSVLAEVEFQFETASRQVELTTADLLITRDRLRERQAILNRRLRDIYKRGALHTARVLLGADSFSELLHRYRFLQVIATYDRALVENVRRLESELTRQSQDLQQSMAELGRLREAQLAEVAQLRSVENTHQRTLQQFRTQEGQATSRLDALEEDERRLTSLVADLERRRLEEERRLAVAGAPAAAPATLSTADIGILDWPVQGSIVYNFGPERRSNGTVLRWNGIGIRAAVGTPVRAVRGGTVELAGSFDGYGPSVIVSHGGGYYTLYLYLEEIGVVQGRRIETGQVVGTVGGAGTPEGARLEFQIRAPVNGSPQAMDPIRWLRPR